MARLKLFNGRSHGSKYKRHHVYVAATSMKDAARLVSMACFDGREDIMPVSEIRIYYSKGSWGTKMQGIEANEPCVYMCDESDVSNKPFRVV